MWMERRRGGVGFCFFEFEQRIRQKHFTFSTDIFIESWVSLSGTCFLLSLSLSAACSSGPPPPLPFSCLLNSSLLSFPLLHTQQLSSSSSCKLDIYSLVMSSKHSTTFSNNSKTMSHLRGYKLSSSWQLCTYSSYWSDIYFLVMRFKYLIVFSDNFNLIACMILLFLLYEKLLLIILFFMLTKSANWTLDLLRC